MLEIKEIKAEELTEDVLYILTDAFKHPKLPLEIAKLRFFQREMTQFIHTFVMWLDGKVIGTASVIIETKLFGDYPFIGHVEDVAIHKDVRGFGYGKELMLYVIEFCRKRGCRKIVLYCSNDNIKFYKKCGFFNACNLMRKDLK